MLSLSNGDLVQKNLRLCIIADVRLLGCAIEFERFRMNCLTGTTIRHRMWWPFWLYFLTSMSLPHCNCSTMPTLFVQCGGHGDQSMAPPSRAKIFCNGSSLQHTVSTLLYTTQFKSTIGWILPQTGNIGCYRYKTHFRLRSLPFHSTLQQIKFFVTCHRFLCLNLLTDFGRACLWVTVVFHFFCFKSVPPGPSQPNCNL